MLTIKCTIFELHEFLFWSGKVFDGYHRGWESYTPAIMWEIHRLRES